MSKLMVVVVLLCAHLILSTNYPAAAQAGNDDCTSVVNKILSCKNYLENPTPAISRGTQYCCDALRNINIADSDVGKCLKQSPFGDLPSRVPGICNLPGLSSLVALATEKDQSQTTGGFRLPFPKIPLPIPKIPLPFPFPFELPFPFNALLPTPPTPTGPQHQVSPPRAL